MASNEGRAILRSDCEGLGCSGDQFGAAFANLLCALESEGLAVALRDPTPSEIEDETRVEPLRKITFGCSQGCLL